MIKDITNGKLISSFNQNHLDDFDDIQDVVLSYWQPSAATSTLLISAYQATERNYVYFITGTLAVIDNNYNEPMVSLCLILRQ